MESFFGTLLAKADFENDYHYRLDFENDFHYRFGSPYVQKSLLERFGLSKSFGG